MELSPRDRGALMIAGGCFLFFILFQFIVYPAYDRKKRLERSLITRQENLMEMKVMQEKLKQLTSLGNSVIDKLEGRKDNFSLFSFLEEKAGKNGIKDKIAYMKPSDTIEDESFRQILVEMKLQSINLKQLVSFLKDVESPENLVALQRISIQENKRDEATLDVIMQVVSIDRLEKTGS